MKRKSHLHFCVSQQNLQVQHMYGQIVEKTFHARIFAILVFHSMDHCSHLMCSLATAAAAAAAATETYLYLICTFIYRSSWRR